MGKWVFVSIGYCLRLLCHETFTMTIHTVCTTEQRLVKFSNYNWCAFFLSMQNSIQRERWIEHTNVSLGKEKIRKSKNSLSRQSQHKNTTRDVVWQSTFQAASEVPHRTVANDSDKNDEALATSRYQEHSTVETTLDSEGRQTIKNDAWRPRGRT